MRSPTLRQKLANTVVIGLAVGVVALVAGAPASRATPVFPESIRNYLALDATPVCQLCHTDAGNAGTATKPFALAMVERGLIPFDVDSLEAALDLMETDAVDSDEDGLGDIDELRQGRDPNTADATGGGVEPLQYGFGCALGPSTPDAALALAVLTLVRRRRRRTVRRRRTIEGVVPEAY